FLCRYPCPRSGGGLCSGEPGRAPARPIGGLKAESHGNGLPAQPAGLLRQASSGLGTGSPGLSEAPGPAARYPDRPLTWPMSTPNYVWHCPTCGRQVPRKFESCRCGFTRSTAAPVPAAPTVEPPPEPDRRGPSPLLVGLLLGLAVAAGMLWWLKEEPAPQRAAVTVPGVEAAPAGNQLPEQAPVP